jgi:hypothetical protein
MKKFYIVILVLASALMLKAGIIEKSYYFDNPTLIQSGEFQMIQFENTLITGKTGEPALPYQSVQLLLPPGEKAISVEFFGEEAMLMEGFYNIYPQQASRPLSATGDFSFSMNEKIYQTSENYPSKEFGELVTSYMNGYAFALSTFTPIQYNPVSGVVTYFQKVTIRIHTEASQQSVKALENLKSNERISNRVNSFAQNAEMISQYPSESKSGDDYQLLIITPAQFTSNFQDLMDTYLQRGIKSEVVTRETINSSGSGQDLAEKIRNYIIQEYQEHNIEYVLLGGDVEHVPYRGFYCYVISGGGYEDENIPADLYFAALDGNWNTDSDNRWGEPGEDDLLPELAIGRFSFSNVTELNNMVHKTMSYQNTPVLGEFNNALMAGEWLYGDPYETWGSDYLELLIGHRTDNGYETWGIPETYNFQKLYEENQSWGANDLITAINSGKQYVHHVGHANSTYVAYMGNSDITDGNFFGANGIDHNYTIFHSHGCICGAFDESDCIMEKMASIANFAVAVVGNSRYGWFNEGQTEGPGAHLHREMVDAMYHEKLNHIGAAFAEAKIQTAPWVTAPGQWEEGALRWNFYDINILGDPTLALWTAEPIAIETVYESEILINAASTSVTVTSNSLPMENFSCSILKEGILYGTGTTDATGVALINFETAFPAEGEAQLIVSGFNCLPTAYPINIVLGTGINKLSENNLMVFPNPTSGSISLVIENHGEEIEISVMNMLNEIVWLKTVENSAGEMLKLDLGNLATGVYFLKAKNDAFEATKKIVIQ